MAPRIVVVGGGISGLTAAYQLATERPDAEVVVLEKEAGVGGTASSDVVDGFLVDRGPNGFLTNVPDAYNLSLELGLGDELLPASDAAQDRFLYFRGRLVPVPGGAGDLLRSPLLSPSGKLRMALEPFLPRGDGERDESVHAFAARRLGREFADVMVSPMVSGVSAGDARQASLAALFPRMRRLEVEHGGLVRGMLAQRRARRAAKRRGEATAPAGGPSGPGGRLTSFRRGGAGRLTEALGRELDGRVRTGVRVERIAAGQERRLRLEPMGMEADAVVLAAPAHAAAAMLRRLVPVASEALAAIPYAGIRVVALGFDRADVLHDLDGFGFLVPPEQDVRILGALWTSTLFPPQAPEGTVLVRALAGGMRDPEFLSLDEDEAVAAVRRDLETSMGIVAEPLMRHVVSWPRGIPQYTLGHRQRVAAATEAVSNVPGLALTGNAYRGIGLNDCVRDARAVAREVAGRLRVA